ncbi:WxL domain-containing protein [Vagococcus salmoninarum]|uniref:WxL domain-containing protein n=1 Tax=Vagococcus salmoninarum TaxID=2739 RepID=A0A429ZHL0_9ENTE|nr:WxL domain-containing protein [Vagococcus salmoninarum]RST93201.1 hypothetical protein CBF35_12065 [Vagococcus salmoninarum]
MKKELTITLATLLLSTSILGSVVAVAAEGGPGAVEGKPAVRNTIGQIIFKSDDGTGTTPPVHPVDPIDPENPIDPVDPIDPEKPVEPGTSGPLSLDFASSFNFGEQLIVPTDMTYYAAPQLAKDPANPGKFIERPLYAQVTDSRGTEAGWNLSVKQEKQFQAATDNRELNGAKIVFTNGQVNTVSESKNPSTVTANLELVPGATQVLVEAAVKEGVGTTVYLLGDEKSMKESVMLNIPGKTTKIKDTYKTSLTWILSVLPGNGEEPDPEQ